MDTAKRRSEGRKVLVTLAGKVWGYRRRLIFAVALLVVAKLAAVAVPLVLKRIVDVMSRPEGLAALPLVLLGGYALTRFATTLFGEIRDVVFARVTQGTVADFTLRIFSHLHALPASFHLRRSTGALTRDVERGTAAVGFLLGVALFTIVPTVVEIGAVLAIMIADYALEFTLVMVMTFIAYVIFTVIFTRRRSIHQRQVNELDSSANRRLVDSLLNYETVKVYANEPFEARRFGMILGDWIEAAVRNQKALSTLHIGQSGIIAAGVGAIMVLAGRGVMDGAMTVGDLILINAYVIQICLPLNNLGFVFREASDSRVKTERLLDLLGERPEAGADDSLPALEVHSGDVRFERVAFGYEPGRQVLWDIDLHITPGSTVAVVGGSGSGKSTLARLLLRFYDVSAGRITIDGRDVRSVSPRSLRSSIGIVPQDTSLFNETVAYNIAYGRVGATPAEIADAARAAEVHEFIEALPRRYETLVGERGLKLSGGEKQRVAIARAILKNPPILVFDEATSALDTRSERAIQDELNRLARDRTTLLIAHRLSTVVHADQILVLEKGRIVERGRHEELLDRRGIYAQMWSLQQQERELERAEQRAALQPVDLNALVATALDGLRPDLEMKGLHVFTFLESETGRVTGDPGELQQVVWDLVGRAIRVSDPSGRIEVRLERAAGEVRFVVSDTQGSVAPLRVVGAPADIPTIPGTRRRFDPGRIRRIVEEHHGRLMVEHGVQGTTHFVTLPMRAVSLPAQDVAETPGARPGETRFEGRRILVVDDSEDAREVLAAVLQDRGAAVEALAGGEDLLTRLRRDPHESWPDVLVCDIGLEGEDGYSVLRHVRSLEAGRGTPLAERIPAIALTGHVRAEDRMRALLAGFQLHLGKPVDPRELYAAIASLLDGGGANRPARRTTT